MLKFYLAAGFSRKEEIAAKSCQLVGIGVGVTSTWPTEKVNPNHSLNDVSDEYLRIHGEKDIREIDEADGVILFTQECTKPFVRGGRMHEFGYAHGRGKRLIVCGPRENIFHYIPGVEVFPTWNELVTALEAECQTQN
jgi:nucleoside 2-deoxyribosyltransferase